MLMKFLLIALALVVLYKLITNERGRKKKNDSKTLEKKIATGKAVKDPICGTYVDVENGITVRDGEKKYHFCSYDCREHFLDKLEDSGRSIPQREEED